MTKKLLITEDPNSEMLKIEYEGKYLFEGNYWDFDRCGESFRQMFKAMNIKVEMKEKPYDEWHT